MLIFKVLKLDNVHQLANRGLKDLLQNLIFRFPFEDLQLAGFVVIVTVIVDFSTRETSSLALQNIYLKRSIL
jgi:hypothetical protein